MSVCWHGREFAFVNPAYQERIGDIAAQSCTVTSRGYASYASRSTPAQARGGSCWG
jgi:hypothetical protein